MASAPFASWVSVMRLCKPCQVTWIGDNICWVCGEEGSSATRPIPADAAGPSAEEVDR